MAQAPLLLTSVADCGKHDAVVVWDPIAGNTVATFSGDPSAPGTLTVSNNIIFSAVNRKPIIQSWSFRSNSSFKRITTKGIVSALAFSHDGFFVYLAIDKSIYIYQVCSGCLIAVLEASHIAPIGTLIVSQRHFSLPIPLLLSADTSGLVACWPALVSVSENVAIGNRSSDDTTANDTSHKPLWYVVQASRGLPACTFVADGQMVVCVGTDGVKMFNSETGRLLYSTLEDSRPLLCVCSLPRDDRYVFAGTDNGILHSIWLHDPKNSSYEVSFRRCFMGVELASTEKAISCVCASPVDSGAPLLAVSTRAGLVEVLRQDACLTRLHCFSVVPPPSLSSGSNKGGSPRITGFIMLSRPDWLHQAQALADEANTVTDSVTESKVSNAMETLRPIKRHLGWQVDDLVYLRLPNLKRDFILDDFLRSIYHDDFLQPKGCTILAPPMPIVADDANGRNDELAEMKILKKEKEALEKRNGELMRILVANSLHY